MWSAGTLLSVFANLLVVISDAHAKQGTSCSAVKAVKVDLSRLSHLRYVFAKTSDEIYSCTVLNRSFVKNETGMFQMVKYTMRLNNGSIIKGDDQIWLPDTEDGLYVENSNYGNSTDIYAILDTDYKDYAVEYLCWKKYDVVQEKMYLSTRSQNLPKETKEKLESIVKTLLPEKTVEINIEACAGLD